MRAIVCLRAPSGRIGRSLALVALLSFWLIPPARAADGPRYIPLRGTTYVLRMRTERSRDGVRYDVDERDIERTVTASDGIDGVIDNRILDIRGGFVDKLSPDDKKVYLSVLSADFRQTTHYMVPLRNSYVTWPLNAATVHLPPFSMIASMVIETTCDEPALRSFFPIGHLQKVAVPCDVISHWQGTARPLQHIEMVMNDQGGATAETPAGTFAVRKLALTQSFASGGRIEQTVMFSESLGIAVLVDSVSASTIDKSVLRFAEHRELLRVEAPAR